MDMMKSFIRAISSKLVISQTMWATVTRNTTIVLYADEAFLLEGNVLYYGCCITSWVPSDCASSLRPSTLKTCLQCL
jgi:hypothetical protein